MQKQRRSKDNPRNNGQIEKKLGSIYGLRRRNVEKTKLSNRLTNVPLKERLKYIVDNTDSADSSLNPDLTFCMCLNNFFRII